MSISSRRQIIVLTALAIIAGCSKSPPTLIPVPDQESRVEVRTADSGWAGRVGDLLACVLRVDRASQCNDNVRAPACDTRSFEAARLAVQPIVDSLPKVTLTPFATNRDFRKLFPSATPSLQVMDARRTTACMDWAGGACAGIRTDEFALVFEGTPGAPPERVLIFRVSPPCPQDRPDREN